MSDWLTKKVTLVLTKSWQVHDTTTPQQALSQMATNSMVALDIDADNNMIPVTWDQWLKLPVREDDISIGTTRGLIRCPTVVVCSSFNKTLTHRPKLSKKAIYHRDGGKCQYTGRQLNFHEANLDHVMPLSRGGATSFDNLVLSDIKVNSAKSDKTPEEAGLKLLRRPTEPRALPRCLAVQNTHGVKEWDIFLQHHNQ